MYTDVSEAFAEKITSHSRTFRAKLVFSDITITDGIYSIKTKGGSCTETQLQIGCAVATTAEIVIEETKYSFKNKEFTLYIGLLLDDDSIEYVPCGVYTVRTVSTKDRLTTLNVADRMYRADKVYKTQLRFPAAADKVMNEICRALNAPYDIDGLENISLPFAPSAKATMREVIGKIAMLAGCNAVFDRLGSLKFKWYEDSGYVTDLDFIDDPEIDEDDYTISYLMCNITDTIFETYGDEKALQGMTVTNEFATKTALEPVWEKIGGTSYRPCLVKMILGDIRIDPWDRFDIDMGKVCVSTIAMNIDFEFDGGLLCTVSATAPDTDSGYISPAQVKEQKQAERLRNNTIVMTAENDQACSVNNTETKLLSLPFTTQQESLPFINVTIQLEIAKSGVVTALVKINHSVHSSYSITVTEGYDIISFSTPFTDLADGTNQLDIYIVGTDDGIADIQAKKASVILMGNGLVARTQAQWNGRIDIEEYIGDIPIGESGYSIDKFKDTVTAAFPPLEKPGLVQGIGNIAIGSHSISIDGFGERLWIAEIVRTYTLDSTRGRPVYSEYVTIDGDGAFILRKIYTLRSEPIDIDTGYAERLVLEMPVLEATESVEISGGELSATYKLLVQDIDGTVYTMAEQMLVPLEERELTASLFESSGFETMPDWQLLKDLDTPSVLSWCEDTAYPVTATVKGTPPPQYIESTADLSSETVLGIAAVNADYSGDVKVQYSYDGEQYSEQEPLADFLATDLDTLYAGLAESRTITFRFWLTGDAALTSFTMTYRNGDEEIE